MSLKDREWWPALLERLRFEPLPVLAREFGENIADLCEELATIGANGPAQHTPWWPEARRLRNTTPIREIARRFHTNPRRIRRAMARTSLRVGGRELGSRGLPELQPFREQLGRVPDWRIAKAAKVTTWAVQGERRRSNIPGFRPRPGSGKRGLSQDEEAWILGPVRPRRDRVRIDPEAVQVVRRPGMRGGEPIRPTGPGQAPMSLRPRDEQPSEVPGRPMPARTTGTRRIIRPDEPVLAPPPPPSAPTVVKRSRRSTETTWRPVDPLVLEQTEERVPLVRRAEAPTRPAPWTPATADTWQARPSRTEEPRETPRPRGLPAPGESLRPHFPAVEGSHLLPAMAAAPAPEPVRRGRGRPPKLRPDVSSGLKALTPTPAQAPALAPAPIRRGPGRPPKLRPDVSAGLPAPAPPQALAPAPIRRGPGRPPKLRPDVSAGLPAPAPPPTLAPAPIRRGPGRPPKLRPETAQPRPVVVARAPAPPPVATAPAPLPRPAPAATAPRPLQKWLAQGPEGLRLQIEAPDVLSAALRLKSILPAAQLAQVAWSECSVGYRPKTCRSSCKSSR